MAITLQAFPVRRNRSAGNTLVRHDGSTVQMTRAGFSTASFAEMRDTNQHNAVDISAPEGWWVVAATDGIVPATLVVRRPDGPPRTYKGVDVGENAGQFIYIDDPAGNRHLYAHLVTGSPLVSPGQRVTAGQVIAQVGHTGNANAAHLHYAIHANHGAGAAIDPTHSLTLLRPPSPDPGVSGPINKLWWWLAAAAITATGIWYLHTRHG